MENLAYRILSQHGVCCVDLRHGETPQNVVSLLKPKCGARSVVYLSEGQKVAMMVNQTRSRGLLGRRLLAGFLTSPTSAADVSSVMELVGGGGQGRRHALVLFVHYSGQRQPKYDPNLAKLQKLQICVTWSTPSSLSVRKSASEQGVDLAHFGFGGRVVLGKDNQRFLHSLAATGGQVDEALALMGETDRPEVRPSGWTQLRRLGELHMWEQNGGEGRCCTPPDVRSLCSPEGLEAAQLATLGPDDLNQCWEEAERFSEADGLGPAGRQFLLAQLGVLSSGSWSAKLDGPGPPPDYTHVSRRHQETKLYQLNKRNFMCVAGTSRSGRMDRLWYSSVQNLPGVLLIPISTRACIRTHKDGERARQLLASQVRTYLRKFRTQPKEANLVVGKKRPRIEVLDPN